LLILLLFCGVLLSSNLVCARASSSSLGLLSVWCNPFIEQPLNVTQLDPNTGKSIGPSLFISTEYLTLFGDVTTVDPINQILYLPVLSLEDITNRILNNTLIGISLAGGVGKIVSTTHLAFTVFATNFDSVTGNVIVAGNKNLPIRSILFKSEW